MPRFLDYVEAMNTIEGDTEGDVNIYLFFATQAYGIQGNIAEFEFLPMLADAEGANSNKGTIPIEFEVYGSNQTIGKVDLPNLSIEAEGEVRAVRGQIYWPVIQVDGYMTFTPWGEVILPALQVDSEGNPNRIYELCLNTNEGI